MRNNNRFYLSGNLGADPEIKVCRNDVTKLNLRLAVNRSKNANGERKTDWFNVGMLFKTSVEAEASHLEFLKDILRKGQEVTVEGHVDINTWKTESGDARTSIEFIGTKVWLGRLLSHRKRSDTSKSHEDAPKGGADSFYEGYGEGHQLPFEATLESELKGDD